LIKSNYNIVQKAQTVQTKSYAENKKKVC